MEAASIQSPDVTVTMLAQRGRLAQVELQKWNGQSIDDLVSAVAWSAFREDTARTLSEFGVRETGFGKVEDTCLRLRQRIEGVLCDLHGVKTSGVVEVNQQLGIQKIAKPLGLIAAITPATAPAAAVLVIALMAIKTRNAVVFCPNPRARQTVNSTVQLLRRTLEKAGAPPDVLQSIPAPTKDSARELMARSDLVLAAGSRGAVERAYSSGRPAYGAGDGNAIVVVDETADLLFAAKKIIDGKAFDNGTSCSSESCVVVARACFDEFVGLLRAAGGFLCNSQEAAALRHFVWPDGKSLSRAVVGQSAPSIGRLAGLSVPQSTRVLMVEGDPVVRDDPVSTEKLSPILGLWSFDDSFDHAISLVNGLTAISGCGHSCGIFSSCIENIGRIGAETRVSRVMVNQSTCFGNTGSFDNGMPFSVLLSCGTWGGSITTENISLRHLLNYTWMSEPVDRHRLPLDQLFGRHWLSTADQPF